MTDEDVAWEDVEGGEAAPQTPRRDCVGIAQRHGEDSGEHAPTGPEHEDERSEDEKPNKDPYTIRKLVSTLRQGAWKEQRSQEERQGRKARRCK